MNPNEEQIRRKWRGDSPVVSVVCIAYNHEEYLRDAMQGFLMQETDFPFEIIVHDDCSTDGTAGIIREYLKAYPGVVRAVFQPVNQYSRGGKCFLLAAAHAVGEYVAVCEGDDYWTDPEKLQRQVEQMRRHPQCQLSFHPAWKEDLGRGGERTLFCRRGEGDRIFIPPAIIAEGGSFMPTASLMLTRRFMDQLLDPAADFHRSYLTGFFIQFFGALEGGALYLDRTMSVYRHMSKGSWSETTAGSARHFLAWGDTHLAAIAEADRLTGGRYRREFDALGKRCLHAVLRNCSVPAAERGAFGKRHGWSWRDRLAWILVYRNDRLTGFLRRLARAGRPHRG
ncbi:hypothetical protein GMSM_20850 [Geomonas sp. Red276]